MKANYRDYLVAKNYSENTIKNYVKYVEGFLAYSNKAEEEVEYIDLVTWAGTFKEMSVNSQNIRIAAIKNYFRFMLDCDYIDHDPTEKLKAKRLHEGDVKRKPYIDSHYLRDMVNAANTLRNKAIILLYATTGLRVSELTGITVEQYNNMTGQDNRELEIIGKGNKRRFVYINDEAKAAIDAYLASKPYRNSDYLFVGKTGNQIHASKLNETLKTIAKNAGVPFWKDISNHCLRSAFATTKNEQNVPLTTIQAAMGHSRLSTTLIYVKTAQGNINKAMMNSGF